MWSLTEGAVKGAVEPVSSAPSATTDTAAASYLPCSSAVLTNGDIVRPGTLILYSKSKTQLIGRVAHIVVSAHDQRSAWFTVTKCTVGDMHTVYKMPSLIQESGPETTICTKVCHFA